MTERTSAPSPGPLAGIRVLDISQVVSGPLAAQLLAEQGADVVKVEPLHGDLMRMGQLEGLTPLLANNNRGKRSIAVDTGQAEGLAIVLDLARDVDVFIENFRPGVCDRIGVGEDAIRAVAPGVIYTSISGFGPTGPYADRACLDPVIQGLTGMVDGQKSESLPFPDLLRTLVADKTTAYAAAQAVTAALFARERGAAGQKIEIPMLDTALAWFWVDGMSDRTLLDAGDLFSTRVTDLYQLVDTRDGQIVYYLTTEAQLHGMYRALERDDLLADERYNHIMAALAEPEHALVIGQAINEGIARFTTDEIIDRLAAESVPAGPILRRDQVEADAQVRFNEVIEEWEHPVAGRIRQPRPAARFSETPATLRRELDLLGGSTDALLRELGRSEEEIAALRTAGTIL